MPLTAGTRLGPYEIVAPLGAGGMGEVYRARDTKLGRDAAVKLLLAETAENSQRRQRFEQEARSASALNHPNIVTIYDIGSSDGTVYIAMELVEGRTLRELLVAEPLAIRKLLELGVQIADGLARAHAAGIVHRDLKPENVMVTRDGFVKILDFGLAKLTEPISQERSAVPTAIAAATEPGVVMGTAGYMSPEQASGQAVDFRSDQFTLGAILYEMTSGKRAFQRQTGAETLVAIIREEPEPIAQANPKAPAPLRWIVERCLAKDPEDRYASTKDLARDLRSVREHLSEASASAGIAVVEPARARRRGWLLPAALALLAGAAAALFVGRTTGMFEPPAPQFQRLTFRRGAILTARFAPDGNTVVYGAAWEDNPVEVFATRPESPESKSLGFPRADVLSVSRSGELALSLGRHVLAGWESSGTLARVPMSGGAPREVLENVQEADWSPDGKELAVTHRSGPRVRLEYPIGTVRYEASGWVSHARISRDGRYLAFVDHPERADSAGRLMILDLTRSTRTGGPFLAGNAGFAWSPRGEIVLGGGGQLRKVFTSGEVRPLVAVPGGIILEDVAADGRMLVKRTNYRREIVSFAPGEPRDRNLTWLDWSYPDDISDDGGVVLFDEQGRDRKDYLCYVRRTDGSPAVLLGKAKGFALSPDGRWALTTNEDASQLALLPTGAGSPRPLPKAGLTYQWGEFLPDGKRLVVAANETGHGSRLYVQELNSAKPGAITPEGYSALQKGVSPDGRWVAAVGPDRRIFICSTAGGTPRPLPGSTPDEHPTGWTADGRSIYVAGAGMPARVEVCDVATGRRMFWKDVVPPDPAGILAIGPILITPDGKSYVYSYRRTLEDLYLVTLKR